jgi:carbon-monoxide dehydrogenase large subunit
MNGAEFPSSRLIGRSMPRLEDEPLLRGTARFVDDIELPDMLHAAFLRSSMAHARITRLDATAARLLPGVSAVLTAEDLTRYITKNELRVALPSPAFRLDLHRPVLVEREVRHVGEPIAVVIAESRYIAEDALTLIEVDYDPLPAVTDPVAALAKDAPCAHSDQPHNLVGEFRTRFGKVEAAFAEAAHIFRAELLQHRGGSHSLECRGDVAVYDRIEDKLTLWSSTQAPHAARQQLAKVLGRPESQLRVVTPDVGGGFGPKLVFYPEDVVVCVAALHLQRPVKWIEDRREHFTATTQERDQAWTLEIAVDDQARILGLRGEMILDHGAYTARGLNVAYGSAHAVVMPYEVPTFDLNCRVAATNKVPVTPVRGAGQPQGVFAMERMLDIVAQEMKLDRAEVRRRNLVRAGDMPRAKPLITRGGIGVVLDSGSFPGAQSDALEAIGWDDFKARQQAAREEGRYIGLGLANFAESTGRGPFEPATVKIGITGQVEVISGAAAMGQSTKSMLAQIVADELGLDMRRLAVVTGDTAVIGYGIGGFNSRQTVMAGNSAHLAARALRGKILKVAAHHFQLTEDMLRLEDGAVCAPGRPEMVLGFGAIAEMLAGVPGYTLPPGVTPTLEATEFFTQDAMAYTNGTAACEVEVEVETGDVRVTRFVLAHDCGQPINPMIVDGQLTGGIAHGIGNALFERMAYDDQGQPVTTNFGEYLLVGAGEMPDVELVHRVTPTYLNPLGVKGVGEAGVLPTPAAIVSAIEDALSPFNIRIRQVPIAPQDIVALIAAATVPHDVEVAE